jgi:hypothetical protein
MVEESMIMQHARNDTYGRLLDMTEVWHRAYAARHGMRYYRDDGRIVRDPNWAPHWDQVALMLEVLDKKVVQLLCWLDADAMIVGVERDWRPVLHGTDMAMVRHPGPPEHWNCGVMYVRNTQRVRGFLREVLHRAPGFYPWYQQQIMNDVLGYYDEYKGLASRAGDEWNATWGVNEHESPVVVAWHNGRTPEEKADQMRQYAEGLHGWV